MAKDESMIPLPYKHFILETHLSPDEAQARLAAQLRPPSWRNSWRAGPPYEGRLQDSHFEISRVINYRNSFLPTISGEMRPTAQGAEIEITLQLQPLVRAFMLLWMGLLMVFTVLILCGVLVKGNWSIGILVPILMSGMGYGICVGPFHWEARKDVAFLTTLFSGMVLLDAPAAPPLPVAEEAPPVPTQRLPRPWAGGTPAAQRYGNPAPDSAPLPTAGADHDTQHLP
jgi:hypothetical protein